MFVAGLTSEPQRSQHVVAFAYRRITYYYVVPAMPVGMYVHCSTGNVVLCAVVLCSVGSVLRNVPLVYKRSMSRESLDDSDAYDCAEVSIVPEPTVSNAQIQAAAMLQSQEKREESVVQRARAFM